MLTASLCILSVNPRPNADADWPDAEALAEGAAAGFGALMWPMTQGYFGSAGVVPDGLFRRCRDAGLDVILDIDVSRFPIDHPMVDDQPALFALRRTAVTDGPVDPRVPMAQAGEALARLRTGGAADALIATIADRLIELLDSGVRGFCFGQVDRFAPGALHDLVGRLRAYKTDVIIIARGCGSTRQTTKALRGSGIDAVVTTFDSRTLRNAGLVEARRDARPAGVLIADVAAAHAAGDGIMRNMAVAAAAADGLIVPLELAQQYPAAARQAVEIARRVEPFRGEMRQMNSGSGKITALLRADTGDVRDSRAAMLVLINTTDVALPVPEAAHLVAVAGAAFEPFYGDDAPDMHPAEVRLAMARRAQPIMLEPNADGAIAAAQMPRLVIEDVAPTVADGYPVKRVVGEAVPVEASIFADGHEQLAVELWWRATDTAEWSTVPMAELPNYRWKAQFAPTRLGRYEFFVEAWLDRFGGFARDFRKKLDAGVATSVDHAEGRLLVEMACERSEGPLGKALASFAEKLKHDDDAELLLSDKLATAMAQADDRPHRLRSAVQPLDAERLAARFSSWYELFPRSQSKVPGQHGTFDDVVQRLPAIRDMGFDTLYFPPIHPIGTANRKGPNNTLTPAPGDPGSPYAIGSADGGHDAIHPDLGSLADFLRLVDAARAHGLEIALDFAIQCSPDHPWLREHPGWFAWRPDGSMKYAENPPKKYQDIVNVEFYAKDAVPGLWVALRDVVLLWIGHGIKTFRVDNPHTKTLPFWEWTIGDVRARHPDAIFLAEAFTKPAMMYRLAKVGFSQSYTYFTWRDEKAELTDYITELTTTAPREFYRPHFFVNTPDINPLFLQTSGRAGFRIRAVLAATLSGLFGVYSGFELCEAAPVPGKDEYLDSEKYELRQRDWAAAGNIIADITMLNRLRRTWPALQTHLNTRFYTAHNEQIIYYAKPATDGADMILVMVSLDPHNAQEAAFEVPLWEFGLPDTASIAVEDLADGHRFDWHGKIQHIRLDPDLPYRIWRLAPGETA